MVYPVRSAPAIRAGKPRVKVSPDTRSTSSGWGVLALAILVVSATVAAWIVFRAAEVDPHFAAARTMLAGYEDGRPQDQRNYNNPVYGKVLLELRLVDRDSPSAVEAAALSVALKQKITAFQAMMNQKDAQLASRREHRREREELVYQAHERARLNPVVSYPECENEGSDHSRSHKH